MSNTIVYRKLTCQWQRLLSKTWQVQRRSRGLGWSGLRALVEKPTLEVLGPLWAAGLPHPCCTKVIVLVYLWKLLLNAPQFQWEAKQRLSLGVCSEFLDASKIEAHLAGRVRGRKLKTQTTSLPYLLLSLVRKPCDTHSSISKLWYHWVRYSNCEIQMAQTVWWLQAHVDVCMSGASFCFGLEIK